MKTLTFDEQTQEQSIRYLAKLLQIKPERKNLEGLAEAAYDNNDIFELVEALRSRSANKTDCDNWGISPRQWRTAIADALSFKFYTALTEIYEAELPEED
jgi:hypothetical protein